MRVRGFMVLSGIVSALLGALVVYLMLSVPNDLRADGLLKEARKDITAGQNDKARASLLKVVQQYPRTDAAAAATAALVSLAQKDRDELARAITVLRTQNEQNARLIADLQKSVAEVKSAPPKVVTVQAPAPKPAVKKAPPKKKPAKRRRR
ncbi:MAG: hypothetical protein ACJ74H_03040 [Thermoanaerobaculia bacterium]